MSAANTPPATRPSTAAAPTAAKCRRVISRYPLGPSVLLAHAGPPASVPGALRITVSNQPQPRRMITIYGCSTRLDFPNIISDTGTGEPRRRTPRSPRPGLANPADTSPATRPSGCGSPVPGARAASPSGCNTPAAVSGGKSSSRRKASKICRGRAATSTTRRPSGRATTTSRPRGPLDLTRQYSRVPQPGETSRIPGRGSRMGARILPPCQLVTPGLAAWCPSQGRHVFDAAAVNIARSITSASGCACRNLSTRRFT